MPFAPLFAAALALSDGGHQVHIQQIAGSTEIVLAHDEQRSRINDSVVVASEHSEIIQSHPDHRIHFQQSEQSDLLFQKTSADNLGPQDGAIDRCLDWCDLHAHLLVYSEEWRDLRIRANEQTRCCPEKVQGLASTVMLV